MQPEDLMLLTDFYEYTMAYAYFKENKHEEIAYFDMFVRTIPDGGGFLILNGLHRFIDFVQHFHYTDDQIDYLRQTGYFDEDFLHYLKTMTMDVDVWAIPEEMCIRDSCVYFSRNSSLISFSSFNNDKYPMIEVKGFFKSCAR